MTVQARLVGLLLLIGLAFDIHWRGVNQGQRLERADWQAKDSARIAAGQKATLKAIENNTRIAQQQEIDKRKVINEYQTELAAVRTERDRNRTGSLCLPATICHSAAAATKAGNASGIDAAIAGAVAVPDAHAANLRDLARDADEVAAMARALQESVKTSGCYAE
jgi:hypothetical protein